MKLQLGPKYSDIFVLIYILGTLYIRFRLESQLNGHWLASLALGGFALLFLWALAKSKYINPTWFGLAGHSAPDEPNVGKSSH